MYAYMWRGQSKIFSGGKNYFGGQNIWIKASNSSLFGTPLLKAQND